MENNEQNNEAIPSPTSWTVYIFKFILMQVISRYIVSFFQSKTSSSPAITLPNIHNKFDLYDVHVFYCQRGDLEVCEQLWVLNNLEYNFSWRDRKVDYTDVIVSLSISPKCSIKPIIISPVYLQVNVLKNQQIITRKEFPLVIYIQPFAEEEGVSLLDSDITIQKEKLYCPHWKSKIDIRYMYDSAKHTNTTLKYLLNGEDVYIDDLNYYPHIDIRDLWLIEKDYILVESESDKYKLNISYATEPVWFYTYIKAFKMLWTLEAPEPNTPVIYQFNMTDNNKDKFMLKRILLDTNIYYLIFTGIFVLVHSLFSFLAFKNEVQFWSSNNSMKGLSALSLFSNIVCEIIIALYLMDSEKASKLIIIELFMSLGISFWKLTKAMDVKFHKKLKFITISEKQSYMESNTNEFDKTAIKLMSYILSPCVVGYALYSLKYKKFRSWYSYVVNVCAGAVYTFGFIMMTPQLYINYKLKSVDHLPWRALIYKSLNTFIDDVFAFLIDMPWLHRIACFRDDIVFICYIYQMWIYRPKKLELKED